MLVARRVGVKEYVSYCVHVCFGRVYLSSGREVHYFADKRPLWTHTIGVSDIVNSPLIYWRLSLLNDPAAYGALGV